MIFCPIFNVLTPVPTLLFSDNIMRKPIKSLLIQSLLGKEYQLVNKSEIETTKYKVVDGGALLRNVVWKLVSTIKEVIDKYSKYVKLNYGKATIIFDGYGNNPSTEAKTECPDVKIEPSIKVQFNQQSYVPFK